MNTCKLTKEQKRELVARYVAGEKGAALAAEYGVHDSYPGLLRRLAGAPKRVMRIFCSHCHKPLGAP